MLSFLKRAVTWWNGQTLGTQFFTWRKGRRVGTDEQGNIYYEQPGTSRRWVIYNGEAEASRVPPDWFGWLHHTFDRPPTEAPLPAKAWQKPHQENVTGTDAAYAPPGSIRNAQPVVRRDYEAWRPD